MYGLHLCLVFTIQKSRKKRKNNISTGCLIFNVGPKHKKNYAKIYLFSSSSSSSSRYKMDYFVLIKDTLNPEGHQNCISG